jgi:chromosome segregation ATPase
MAQQVQSQDKRTQTQKSPVAGSKPAAATPPPVPPQPAVPGKPPEQELERVREIILGPDRVHQRLPGAEVDRLRQVIFGAQMEEYDRRFSDLSREMDRMLTDMRLVQDSVSEFEKTQTKRIEGLEREMRRNHDEVRRELDRLSAREAMVQQLLTRTQQQELFSRGVSDRVSEVRDAFAQQERELSSFKGSVSEHRDQQERKLEALKREVRQAEDGLRAELRRVADRLGDQKTDRKALAAMLMEIATRLETGSSVTGLLEDLTASAGE